MNITLKDIKTNKNLQKFLATIFLAILMVIAFMFSIKSNIDISKKIEKQQIILNQSQDNLIYLMQLATNEEQLQKNIEFYRERLPVGINQDTLLEIIQNTADQYNVVVSQVSFGVVEKVANTNKLPMELTLSDTYQNIMKVLEELTIEGRIIIIEGISLTAQQGDRVSANVTTGVYYQ